MASALRPYRERVPVTTRLLARLKTLDDLLELVAELGFAPAADELGPGARGHVGLGAESLAVQRAALLGHCGAFRAYGVVLEDAGRSPVGLAAERLARATGGERNLLFALDRGATTLAVAAAHDESGGYRARQLRIPLERPSAVAAEILGGLAPRDGETPVALSLRVHSALAGEGITARFFREFSRQHARAADAVTGMPRATGEERRDFALVVLTRVLFLYFVQAKGWLAGRSDFLPSLLDTALRAGRPFHRGSFEPLCFGALSAPVAARGADARALGPVPFLNGGLFERHALERRYPDAALPDEAWRVLFDELFERFHFTVRERDDDAIDPEMLGRVFEGLMSPDRRRRSGTYFTPRDLLRRTVAAALKAALDGRESDAVLSLRVLDPAAGSGAFLLEALAQLEPLRASRWPGESPGQRRRAIIRDNLYGVDLDPMAVRLAELRLWLALVADDEADWQAVTPLPNLDFNLRQGDSLISPLDLAGGLRAPGTVERARAVAEHRIAYFAATGRHKAELARSIRADEHAIAAAGADAAIASLTARLADVASARGRDLFGGRTRRDPALARRMTDWRRRRRELLGVRRQLAGHDTMPFFAWETHFGDILAAGGFDVIIGNPPWVRGERLPLSTRAMLAARYQAFRPAGCGSRGFAHLPDLSVAFVERSLLLLREGGALGLVVPAKLLRAGYAGPLRALLRRQATLVYLEDRSHASRDFAATVFPLLCVAIRRPPLAAAPVAVVVAGRDPVVGTTTQYELPLEQGHPRSIWLALPSKIGRALRAALAAGPCLAEQFRPRLGVKTGANEVFVRDLARQDELPVEHRVPAIQGRDIAPFRAEPSAALLAAISLHGEPLASASGDLAGYLKQHAALLDRRTDGRGAPRWALFRTDLLRGRWTVLWRDIAGRLEAVALERASAAAPIPLNTCYGVLVPDEYTADWLSAWLNSTVLRTIAAALAERASGGAFRFSGATVGALPLPSDTGCRDVRALASIGRQARLEQEWDPNDLDRHALDALALDARHAALLGDLHASLCGGAGRDR